MQTTTKPVFSATLPYPPTVNHYWGLRVVRCGGRRIPQVYVTEVGQAYQRRVSQILTGVPQLTGSVQVWIVVHPPDNRTRDLDNVLKCLLDSLTLAGLWADDSQVSQITIGRGAVVRQGAVFLRARHRDPELVDG